jgi:hypothetical protein
MKRRKTKRVETMMKKRKSKPTIVRAGGRRATDGSLKINFYVLKVQL